MKPKRKFIHERTTWWDNFTSCFLGTLLGIILTFGTTAIIEYKEKTELEHKALIITLHNLDRNIGNMKKNAAEEMWNDTIFQTLLKHYPDNLHKVSKDTVNMFLGIMSSYSFSAVDNSVETIFSHSIDLWKTLESPASMSLIGDCFIAKKSFTDIQQRLYESRRKIWLDFCDKHDITAYELPEKFLRDFMSEPDNRYNMIEHRGFTSILSLLVQEVERLNDWNKEQLGITDEEINEIFEETPSETQHEFTHKTK